MRVGNEGLQRKGLPHMMWQSALQMSVIEEGVACCAVPTNC